MADGTHDVATMAKLLELDPRRLQQLVKEGWIKQPERGRYSLVLTVRGYCAFLKQGSRETQRGTQHARLASAQAYKVEMENWRRMGELQLVTQVEETMQGLINIMKSSHAGLPGRLASELASVTDPPQVYKRLQDELRAVLNQCADWMEKRADALEAMPEPVETPTAGAADDADAVGGESPDDAGGLP